MWWHVCDCEHPYSLALDHRTQGHSQRMWHQFRCLLGPQRHLCQLTAQLFFPAPPASLPSACLWICRVSPKRVKSRTSLYPKFSNSRDLPAPSSVCQAAASLPSPFQPRMEPGSVPPQLSPGNLCSCFCTFCRDPRAQTLELFLLTPIPGGVYKLPGLVLRVGVRVSLILLKAA